MSEAYRRMVDRLPTEGGSVAHGIPTDVRGVRSWLDQLPMANAASAIRRMMDGIEGLNAHALDGRRRLDAMEALREPAMQLLAWADRQTAGASFPLPRQKHELGEFALRFRAALALGYRLALAGLCRPNGAVPLLRGMQVATAAVRALQHGADELAAACALYRTPPVGAWQGMHDVHRFIADVRLADRKVDDPSGAVDARTVYVQALLHALGNPYRHTQRGQAELNALARALAPLAELGRDGGRPHDVWLDPGADRGPGYIVEEQGYGRNDALVLRLGAVLDVVDRAVERMSDGAATGSVGIRGGFAMSVDAALLRRVAQDWSARPSREHARFGGGYRLDSVLGLHDLHCMLAGGENFDAFMQRVRGEVISLSDADASPAWRSAVAQHAHGMRLPVHVLDHGLGGYRVMWERADGAVSARARVSELVGLSLPDADGDAGFDWMVGVIRWMRIDDRGGVDAGIELLARRALPVGVRSAAGEAKGGRPLPGVLLWPLLSDEEGYTGLVTPTDLDRGVDAVDLAVPADLRGPSLQAHATRWHGLRMVEGSGIALRFARAGAAHA